MKDRFQSGSLRFTDDYRREAARRDAWYDGDREEEQPLEDVFLGADVGDNHDGPLFWLPHQCNAWIIGGVADAKALRDELDSAIRTMETE